jgi:hypothetical protein
LFEALLDTGSDDTIFPEALAAQIGIDLQQAPTRLITSPVGATILLRYSEVTLRLTDGREFREWPARVGFTAVPLRFGLLGFAGCLQYFTATFYGDLEEVELTVNRIYPGT